MKQINSNEKLNDYLRNAETLKEIKNEILDDNNYTIN